MVALGRAGVIFCLLIFLIPLARAAPNGGTTTRGSMCANRLSGCLSKCDNTNKTCREVCSGGWDNYHRPRRLVNKIAGRSNQPLQSPIYKHPILTGGTPSPAKDFTGARAPTALDLARPRGFISTKAQTAFDLKGSRTHHTKAPTTFDLKGPKGPRGNPSPVERRIMAGAKVMVAAVAI